MNKQQLLTGKKFTYQGAFRPMEKEVSLFFDDTFLHDAFGNRFCIVLGEPNDDYFMIWKEGYGSYRIRYIDCQLKNEA